MRTLGKLALAPVLALAVGCSESTCDGIARAERAVMAAQVAGAAQHLAEEFAALEAALAQARREQAYQNEKVFWLRDLHAGDRQLLHVEQEAARLSAEAIRKRREARAAALETLERARRSIRDTQVQADRLAGVLRGEQLQEIGANCLFLLDALDRVAQVVRESDYDTAQVQTELIADAARVLAVVMHATSSTLAHAAAKPRRRT